MKPSTNVKGTNVKSKLQHGFIDIMVILLTTVFGGAVAYSTVNAEKHPEVSKFGRQ